MKRMLQVSMIATTIFASTTAFAATAIDSYDPSLHAATSCAQIEDMMEGTLHTYWNAGTFGPVAMADGAIANTASTKAALDSVGGLGAGGPASDAMQTNVQKAGVEEPDLMKVNGSTIYYLDQQKSAIRVLDASTQKLINTISFPKDYYVSSMLMQDNRLVLLGSKQIQRPQSYYETPSFVYRDNVSFIVVYSLANTLKPSLLGAYTYDGWIGESRIVDGKLVFSSSRNVGRQPVYAAVNDMVYKNTTKSVSVNQFQIKASDVLPQWTTLKQKSYTMRNGATKYSIQKTVKPVDCTQFLSRKMPKLTSATAAKGRMMPMYPNESITSLVTLPLVANAQPTIKMIYGSTPSAIHVTKDSAYLVAPTQLMSQFTCPALPNIDCMPWRGEGQYSTVYRFGLDTLGYKYASLVRGNVYNQYGADEDKEGYLRLVTSDWSNGQNINNVYTLAADGSVLGKLEGVAPGEQPYGVRFIGDYLYFVTFKQVDPLFVIDLTDAKKPTIKAELKMPGYSTYLHPYGAMKDGVQYLIGLGYAMGTGSRGGETQRGLKLDLYKIDFNTKNAKGQVAVSQVWTKTLGGQGSQSEALNNPRMFIYNDASKQLLLPVALADTIKTQQCNVSYDQNGKEIKKDCYPTEQAVTTFAGLKGWTIGTNALTETMSVDYKDILKNPYAYPMPVDANATIGGTADAAMPVSTGPVDPWVFQSLMARVGYSNNRYFMVNTQFAHFFTMADQKGTRIDFVDGMNVSAGK